MSSNGQAASIYEQIEKELSDRLDIKKFERLHHFHQIIKLSILGCSDLLIKIDSFIGDYLAEMARDEYKINIPSLDVIYERIKGISSDINILLGQDIESDINILSNLVSKLCEYHEELYACKDAIDEFAQDATFSTNQYERVRKIQQDFSSMTTDFSEIISEIVTYRHPIAIPSIQTDIKSEIGRFRQKFNGDADVNKLAAYVNQALESVKFLYEESPQIINESLALEILAGGMKPSNIYRILEESADRVSYQGRKATIKLPEIMSEALRFIEQFGIRDAGYLRVTQTYIFDAAEQFNQLYGMMQSASRGEVDIAELTSPKGAATLAVQKLNNIMENIHNNISGLQGKYSEEKYGINAILKKLQKQIEALQGKDIVESANVTIAGRESRAGGISGAVNPFA